MLLKQNYESDTDLRFFFSKILELIRMRHKFSSIVSRKCRKVTFDKKFLHSYLAIKKRNQFDTELQLIARDSSSGVWIIRFFILGIQNIIIIGFCLCLGNAVSILFLALQHHVKLKDFRNRTINRKTIFCSLQNLGRNRKRHLLPLYQSATSNLDTYKRLAVLQCSSILQLNR